MNNLYAYLPQDRRLALSHGDVLPSRVYGTALFADISGFTPLTEKLVQTLGARRGAEELSNHLNQVYDALINALERYGGSVIGFAGDAITCWFDDAPQLGVSAALYGLASALEMQTAMRAFPELALKIALASGPARRFVVGDPKIQLIDTLAGATLARMASGEHLAQKGEILADETTLLSAGNRAQVSAFRKSLDPQAQFGVVTSLSGDIFPQPRPLEINAFEARPWLLPAVYEREQAGLGAFLTELRNAVALFLHFEGIDYDQDEAAGEKLDQWIRLVQEIATHNGGTLLALTIGDKGSYCNIAFGAPVTYENDARRALNTALELRASAAKQPFITAIRIGVSRGTMCTGAYGGTSRRTYGLLGDETNLAARLMQAAAAGQIIVSGRVQYVTSGEFIFDTLPMLTVKGKSQPVTVFSLNAITRHKNYRLLDPIYALPMIGRQAEVEAIRQKMELAAHGQGQVVAITAEAGMGKSRLVAEMIRQSQQAGFYGYGGACQSDGVNTGYLVWHAILRGLLDVDGDAPITKQSQQLAAALENFAPQRLPAMPLVAITLGLSLPENDFSRGLEPKDRKSAIEAALVDCVRGAALALRSHGNSLFLILEDLHWIDALSHDLLTEIAQTIADLPVFILLVYRPPEMTRLSAPRVEKLNHFSQITLSALSLNEVGAMISAKLAQLFPNREFDLPEGVTRRLMEHSQGNPFYLEELLNYLRDRGFDPQDSLTHRQIELPDSLYALVLSRIDQLGEHEKTTLKVASIIGRLFHAHWLTGYYPELGNFEHIQRDLQRLQTLDITLLNSLESELAYLFKHLITQEVTYESLPYATRELLHERLAGWLEMTISAPLPLDLLAYHYAHSNNLEKKREYLLKAGDAAREAYANETALDYYAQLPPLLTSPTQQVELHLKWGAVLEPMGKWEQAENHYRKGLECTDPQDQLRIARCQFALGKLCRQSGAYPVALEWLEQARLKWVALNDGVGLCQTLIEIGVVYHHKANYVMSRQYQEEGLALARSLGNWRDIALALNNLGNTLTKQGDYVAAQAHYEESLMLRRASGDRWGIAMSLNNLGTLAYEQGDYPRARMLHEESLELKRQIGDKRGIANSLNNMGDQACIQGDYPAARAFHEESLALRRAMGNKRGVIMSLLNLGIVAYQQDDLSTSEEFYNQSLVQSRGIGDKTAIAYALFGLGLIALTRSEPAMSDLILESLRLRVESKDKRGIACSLVGVAGVAAHAGKPLRAAQLSGAIEAILVSIKAKMDPEVYSTHAKTIASIRAILSEDAFKMAWAVGEKMPLDEVVSYALDGENS
jgi:class 3 adenylate cyclase/tetratricopeptide (TPR) repeat protein